MVWTCAQVEEEEGVGGVVDVWEEGEDAKGGGLFSGRKWVCGSVGRASGF